MQNGDTHLRGLGRSPKASPRRCVEIKDFAIYKLKITTYSAPAAQAAKPLPEAGVWGWVRIATATARRAQCHRTTKGSEL